VPEVRGLHMMKSPAVIYSIKQNPSACQVRAGTCNFSPPRPDIGKYESYRWRRENTQHRKRLRRRACISESSFVYTLCGG
jgi:hypothetical protein